MEWLQSIPALSWVLRVMRGMRGGAVLAAAIVTAFPAEAAKDVRYEQHRIGKAIVSLPSAWTARGPEIPVWLHLHGAPAVIESNFSGFGAPGILVNITLPGLSKIYADHFADATSFRDLLRELEALLRRVGPDRPWTIGRLTVSSFSAGFGGVRQLLRQPEAFDRVGTLVMADSIYCGYVGDAVLKQVDPELMSGFLRFAGLAAEGEKRLLITHSRQVPEGYASTTETADYLIAKLGGERARAEAGAWPGGLRLLTRFARMNFEVLGFDGEAPEDHMRHLRVIGAFWRRVEESKGGK
jgi:hypothetical protein